MELLWQTITDDGGAASGGGTVTDGFPPASGGAFESASTFQPGHVFVPGSQLAGYQLGEQIGRGGMAVVYRARDIRLDRWVALKILAPDIARDESFRQRFVRESRAAAAVDHPHIIPVFEAGEAAGVLFIAMRYVSGGDVGTLARSGPMDVARANSIIAQVAAALDAAHETGLVHRDVKPANMLLGSVAGSGHPDHVYLSDFGLSKQSLSGAGLTLTGQFMGTLDYMAPEQIESRPIDGRTDLYALACAAFELLSGVPPFRREQNIALMWAQISEPPPLLTSRRRGLPAEVDEVMTRALAKSPDERQSSCLEFAGELQEACGLSRAANGQFQSSQRRPGVAPAGPTQAPGPAEGPGSAQPAGSAQAPGPVQPSGSTAPPGAPDPAAVPVAGWAAAANSPSGQLPPPHPPTGLAAPAHPPTGVVGSPQPSSGQAPPVTHPPSGPSPATDRPASARQEPPVTQPPASFPAPGRSRSGPAASPQPKSGSTPPPAGYRSASEWNAQQRPDEQWAAYQQGPPGQAGQQGQPGQPWPGQPPGIPPGGSAPAAGGPYQAGPGAPGAPAGPSRGRGRAVAIVAVAAVVAVAVVFAILHFGPAGSGKAANAASTSSAPATGSPTHTTGTSPPATGSPSASATSTHNAAAPLTPADTVRAYIKAINNHNYRRAWNLGGRHTASSYQAFVQGFSTTEHDTLTVTSVSGNVVNGRLVAQQTDGVVKTYQGVYTVSNGEIVTFSVRQIS